MKQFFSFQILFLLIFFSVFSCKGNSGKTPNTFEIEIGAAKKMVGSDIVFLDVRTPEECEDGMIPGAIAINFRDADFKAKVSALDKEQEYIVYCRSGNRSGQAVTIMKEAGFKNIKNLLGGYSSWNN